ncbi:TIGR04222 domain-containing membrane protein [Streptomyces sp. NPDC058525]|uniref:TIGR04222 domain-containing membrane protein n=1 Tax=Streptomyces sp. NPDC058525 TaxID=3346538 RepID=UPI0036594E86
MNGLALAIWLAVVASSGLLAFGLYRARPRSAGPAPVLHDLSEAAFMAGGPGAVVDTALVSMLGDGRLVAGGPGIVHVRPGARAGDPAERAVLQAHAGAPSGWLYQVRYAAMTAPAVQETGDGLAARGLLSPPGWGRTWRRWGLIQATVCGLLVPVSLPLTFVGFVMGPNGQVPFIAKVLPVLLGGVVVGGLCAAAGKRRVTPAGRRALREIRSHYVNDRTPHVQTALFGLRGLRDPFLRGLLVPAARGTRLAAAQSGARPVRRHDTSSSSGAELLPVLWCAGSDGGSGGGSGSGCGSGSSCAGAGGGCGSGSSSCSGGSSGGSSCGSSSGSSCSSSSGSSCSSSSSS